MQNSERKPVEIRMPPQNIEAEMSVLGSLMLDKDSIFKVADFLTPKDFYKPIHADIYETMSDLMQRREPIDIVSVTNRLKEQGGLDGVGGSSYLASLVNTVPTASHVAHYASIVKKKRLLRDLIDASQHIIELGYRETDDVDTIIDEAEQRIFAVARGTIKQEFQAVHTALAEAWDRIERLHKDDGMLHGIPTGFPDLDNYLAGLQRSDLIVLAARPSLGKTALALNICRNVAIDHKKAVALFSLEMSKEQLVDRLIASEANVDLWRLRTGRLREDQNEFSQIRDAMSVLSDAPLYLDDSPSLSVMDIRAKARRFQAERDLGLVMIDYLQLIQGTGRVESRVQEVSEISRALKAMAKELNVPVLAVSQLSRAVEMRPSSRPKLSDLRESGSIEQDADVVMFIYREDKVRENSDKKNIAEILIEKHRNGPTGKIDLYFHEETASFRSIDKHYDSAV
ncbi:MAG: replicative DNA helicase [Candidatus Sungbacteria bacterium RIFCSPHIGHO2_01_FULL_50_25]|uniref:Replicative DNA helicase n=1 Tax=Candidatus Sungbacteria bacterium RIFCSPHIGHO2_01_FULL_50_25 TaxID=1802265 RepID=A0A1G2K7T0_9BACT|nr:MAG: replicative DNA helicase [Candidatus Sungbacteria bacterium RIFCSPHIGHO2_01_FULL_50_25]